MKIIVKQLKGGECCLEVSPSTSIAAIKRQVAEKLKIPKEEQKLLHLGRTLLDEQTLLAYPSIKDGVKLNLVVKKPEGLYEVAVKYFKTMNMSETEARATASRLLRIIQEKFDKMSWDDIDKLAQDCLSSERGLGRVPMETEPDDVYSL